MVLARPALAEPRWLACKYTDIAGKTQTFHMVFDDLRNTACFFDDEIGAVVEGTGTSTTFQAVRTRFPQFILTYNRNDGGALRGADRGRAGRHPDRRMPAQPAAARRTCRLTSAFFRDDPEEQ